MQSDLDFFEALEDYVEDEGAIYVHAGIDLTLPEMKQQDSRVMYWVREKFIRGVERWGGKMIVFGHTPTRTLGLKGKQVFTAASARGIDTGCCYGGYLTAFCTESGMLFQEPSSFKY